MSGFNDKSKTNNRGIRMTLAIDEIEIKQPMVEDDHIIGNVSFNMTKDIWICNECDKEYGQAVDAVQCDCLYEEFK